MIGQLSRSAVSAMLVLGLQGCGDKSQEASQQPVRGLRAYKVAEKAESRVRRFPSVLQPADVSGPLLRDRRSVEGGHTHPRTEGATKGRAGGNRPSLAA